MGHYAKVLNSTVETVIVADADFFDTFVDTSPGTWIQTSYNTRGGIYYIPNTNTPDPDQSKAFRKNFAGIGYTWLPNGPEGAGFVSISPYPSWVMNSFSYIWEAPVPMPVPNSPPYYQWDEATVSWVLTPGTDTTAPGAAPNVIG